MSELHEYHYELRPKEYEIFYLKYEVDKVLSDKDAQNENLLFALNEAVAKQGFRNLNIPESLARLMGQLADAKGENRRQQHEINELKENLHDIDNQWNEQCKEIAELKSKNERLTNTAFELKLKHDALEKENERLLKENSCKFYNDCLRVRNYEQELRDYRRALWLARAERAIEKIAWFKLWNASISTMNPEDGARQEFDKWKKNLGKLLAKAEEYE